MEAGDQPISELNPKNVTLLARFGEQQPFGKAHGFAVLSWDE